MRRSPLTFLLITCFGVLQFNTLQTSTRAAEKNPDQKEKKTYLLRYNLAEDEQLNYEVTHVAKTKTRVRGAEEITQVHTISRRHWDVIDRNENDEMVFDHIVDAVEMTQQAGDQDEVRWDSTTGEKPPKIFEIVASQIGSSIATITVNPLGAETHRENTGGSKAKLGMGSLTLSLPEDPIAVGSSWSVPRELKTRTEDGRVKPIKIREVFTLEKVETGVATLLVKSEPLTPINQQSVRAQVIQELSDGVIRFDIDNGHMISKQLDWDETVIGFQGPNSSMEYRARMSEKLIDTEVRTAKRK